MESSVVAHGKDLAQNVEVVEHFRRIEHLWGNSRITLPVAITETESATQNVKQVLAQISGSAKESRLKCDRRSALRVAPAAEEVCSLL